MVKRFAIIIIIIVFIIGALGFYFSWEGYDIWHVLSPYESLKRLDGCCLEITFRRPLNRKERHDFLRRHQLSIIEVDHGVNYTLRAINDITPEGLESIRKNPLVLDVGFSVFVDI